jgi:hypothetical protein
LGTPVVAEAEAAVEAVENCSVKGELEETEDEAVVGA